MLQRTDTSMVADVFGDLDAALHWLRELDLVALDRDSLLHVVREFEAFKRRLAVVDHALIAQLDGRGVAAELCAPSTAALLRGMLRVSPGEAKRRVRAAADLGPRRGFTGEALEPLFPTVADALAAGVISAEHAAVIVGCVDRLPHTIAAEHTDEVVETLLARAGEFDPARLGQIARHLLDVLDPDGVLADDADQQRHRDFTVSCNRDGTSTPSGRFTATLTALIETFLDSMAGPKPADDGTRDPRTPGQRNHDALEDGFTRLLRSDLPDIGGLPAMLILTTTIEDAQTGTGAATTSHGGRIPMNQVIDLLGDGQTMSVQFDPHGGIHDYGQTKRLVPPAMRLALIARDRGCTFPGCDRPPAWTEAHHITAYAAGGPTSLTNTTLVCRHHHREFGKRGWQCVTVNRRPHWIPPAWIDPSQTPRRNYSHDP